MAMMSYDGGCLVVLDLLQPNTCCVRSAIGVRQCVTEERLRACYQYKSHEQVVAGVQSEKDTKKSRQLDECVQAKLIMMARDPGCNDCETSVFDSTYLGSL